ncbi:MAG: phytanoyl-CoA dioxygenase family protein [Pirellulales bacterium]|nr:phytanoyl-CoA dioxygenase family protein [Pirellulales bacterium]
MTQFAVGEEQRDDFQRDGYVIARELFNQQEMDGLLAYAKGDDVLAGEAYVRRDASGAETRLALRNDLDDSCIYTSIVRSRRVAENMRALLGDEVYHYHHKMMLKEPQVGGAWEWHQDYGYWYNFGCLYPDMGSCMIAVDRATKENGCLQVLRGSHKIGRVDHGKTGEQVGADLERVEAARARHELIHVELNPGDALFFHGNLLHRSDMNTSDKPRWTLICCYNTKHNDPFVTDGRHPNYSPLEIWPDERVLETIEQRATGAS